jgi:hypothetical protein
MALEELEVRYATRRQKDYKLADGEGLYVLVRPNGSKLWRLKYRFGGKEKLLSLGAYPDVSLAEARLRRAEAKVALGEGRDPGARDAPARGTTFEEAARAWHANRLSSLEPSHAERLMTRLERDAFPGDKPEQPLSQNTMIYACYRMGYRGRQTVHGFRGLASTWANEAEHYRADWIELALAHAERDEVRGAYNSALYLTPRRRMLQDWGDAVSAMMKGQG